MQNNTTDYSGHEAGNEYKKNYIMGLWKFSDRVPVTQLIEIIKKWAEDSKYIHLYIRQCSKDQHGIGFTYDLGVQESKAGQNKEYMEPVSDSLKRQFGNDLVGWDISSPVWIVK